MADEDECKYKIWSVKRFQV